MLPETFSERHLRVYCKKMDDDSLKIAKECFQKYCAAKNLHPPKVILNFILFIVKSESYDELLLEL